jgi:hypothetical protein
MMEANTMAEPATTLPAAPTSTITDQPPLSLGPAVQPDFDQIELLPEGAQDRLRKLRLRSSDSHAVVPRHEEIAESSMAKIAAAAALSRLTNHPQEFGSGLKPGDPRVVAAERHLAKMTADFARLQELQQVRTAAFQSASQAASACETWLKSGVPGGCTLEEPIETETPKLLKGETVLDGIERLRRRGRELKADIHRVRSACYTKAEAMALVSATVENWGSNGIDTSATIEHLSQPTIPTKTVQAMVRNVPGAPAAVVFVEVPDVVGIFSTVLKDQFIAWLAADVDRNADPEGALSHDQRQQQEAELTGDLLDIERQEAALVWRAMDERLPVEHRADISPLALLALRLVTTPRADALPETTPGYSWPMRR